jgi:hypothetical protein
MENLDPQFPQGVAILLASGANEIVEAKDIRIFPQTERKRVSNETAYPCY